MTQASVSVPSTASPEVIYDLLAEGETWLEWLPSMRSLRLDPEAPGGGEGVGAVRVWNSGVQEARELITVMERPSRFGYRLMQAKLVRLHDYEAIVDIKPGQAGGSIITWSSTFEANKSVTAPFWKWSTERLYRFFLDKLTAHAEGLPA